MDFGSVSRRGLLRQGAITGFAGGIATLAGCASQNKNKAGSTETPSPPTQAEPTDTPTQTLTSESWTGPAYGQWLPAPQTVIPASQYQFGRLNLTAFAEHRDRLPPPVKKNVQRWQPMEIGWRTVPMALSFHGNQVIKTDFDRTTIINQITKAEGWHDSSSYEGYTVVQIEDKEKAIAVGDNAIIIATRLGDTAAATARGIIDTVQGRIDQYPAASEAVDALLDEFQGGFIHQWLPVEAFDDNPQPEPEFDGQTGIGKWAKTAKGPMTKVKYIVVYKTLSAVNMDQVRSYVEERRGEKKPFANWQKVNFRRNGRLAVIEGLIRRNG